MAACRPFLPKELRYQIHNAWKFPWIPCIYMVSVCLLWTASAIICLISQFLRSQTPPGSASVDICPSFKHLRSSSKAKCDCECCVTNWSHNRGKKSRWWQIGKWKTDNLMRRDSINIIRLKNYQRKKPTKHTDRSSVLFIQWENSYNQKTHSCPLSRNLIISKLKTCRKNILRVLFKLS